MSLPIPGMGERSPHTPLEWWNKLKHVPGWYATCPTTLRPDHIDIEDVGHHTSVALERGVRTYSFDNQASRDRFINRYRPHGAKPCKDPADAR